jgi:hypothetical protein
MRPEDSRPSRQPGRFAWFRRDQRDPAVARGGISLAAVLTGVVVAFGAMFLLSALVGGILAASGVEASEVTPEGAREAGLGAGIALVAALFLAYLWGGYTAGRMSRGAGFLNGLLVPVLALIVAAVVAAVVNALGATANLNLPFTESQLPIEGENLIDFGEVVGVASLIALFVGGILGGMLGAGWHTKLERRVYAEREAEAEERREVAVDREREEDRRPLEERRPAEDRRPAAATAETQPSPGRTVAGERRPAPTPPPDRR